MMTIRRSLLELQLAPKVLHQSRAALLLALDLKGLLEWSLTCPPARASEHWFKI
jgi:hypothetical protein